MSKIKVMIVDDQAIMRDGLKTILNTQNDIEVVALAGDGVEALHYAKNLKMDVVLMDIRMPNMDGVECTKQLIKLEKEIKVLILTTFDEEDYIIDALSFGASGYLLKDTDGEGLISAVKYVFKGNILLPNAIANKIASSFKSLRCEQDIVSDLSYSFTSREKDIIKLLVEGYSNMELAKKIFLTEGTIKNYLTSIYSKINTSDRGKAILILQKLEL